MITSERDALLAEIAALEELLAVQERTVAEQSLRLEETTRIAVSAGRAKADFLANMSHEIRTPMNAVIGMTWLLGNTELDPVQKEYLDTVRASGEHLLALVNDILDFSKMESGKVSLARMPFHLRTCFEEAFDIVALSAAEKNIDLVLRIDQDVPAAVFGDANRLRQIAINLLGNAVKFTDRGEVHLLASGTRAPSGEWSIHIRVQDTGPGIPSHQIERLFKSFTQLDSSNGRQYGGTGLGLAISARLAGLMGGRMWVESEVGRGSCFQFTFLAEATELPIAASATKASFDGTRVLVVDDLPINLAILKDILGSFGVEAATTTSPSDVVARIARGERFDAILLDHVMPELDGPALARSIRALAAGADIPLLLLSSRGNLDAPPADADFAAILTKPVKPSLLRSALERALLTSVAREPAEAARSAVVPMTPPRAPPRSNLRILAADDTPVNLKVAAGMLRKLGFEADLASNGREVLEALDRREYDVILMDVQMPELDGLETSRLIRTRYKDATWPRIVAMTASVLDSDRDACREAGMNDYLGKPYWPADILKLLRAYEKEKDEDERAAG